MRSMLVDKQSELKLAEEVYGAPELVIDPFSSAFDVLLNKTSQAKAALRSEAVAVLSALEKADRDWSSFYAGRRGYFTGLSVATSKPVQGKATKDNVGQFQQGHWKPPSTAMWMSCNVSRKRCSKPAPRPNPPARPLNKRCRLGSCWCIPLNSESRSPTKWLNARGGSAWRKWKRRSNSRACGNSRKRLLIR